MTRFQLGRRSLHGETVNVPKQAEIFGFPREGKVDVEYDDEENALVYKPVEDDS